MRWLYCCPDRDGAAKRRTEEEILEGLSVDVTVKSGSSDLLYPHTRRS